MHGADSIVADGTANLPQHRAQRAAVDKKVEPAHRGSPAEIDAGLVGAAEKFREVAIYAHVAMPKSLCPCRYACVVCLRRAACVAAVVARHHVSHSIAGAGRLPRLATTSS